MSKTNKKEESWKKVLVGYSKRGKEALDSSKSPKGGEDTHSYSVLLSKSKKIFSWKEDRIERIIKTQQERGDIIEREEIIKLILTFLRLIEKESFGHIINILLEKRYNCIEELIQDSTQIELGKFRTVDRYFGVRLGMWKNLEQCKLCNVKKWVNNDTGKCLECDFPEVFNMLTRKYREMTGPLIRNFRLLERLFEINKRMIFPENPDEKILQELLEIEKYLKK